METSFESNIDKNDKSLPTAWQHDKGLGDCMIKLYEQQLWTDVKFRCRNHDDQERIYAHKIVLAARSPVFQAMFFGPCAEIKEEIELDNIDTKTFDLFIRYIYEDKVTLTEEIVASVLQTAHFYQVTKLVQNCADFLATCITPQNVYDILSLARLYDVMSLCKECCNLIDNNAEKVMNSEGFLKLKEDTLGYIIKGDTFYANEVDILKKAEEWAQKKLQETNLDCRGQNLRTVLGTSFFNMRLPTMTLDCLLECTRRKGYFSVEEYEDLVDFIYKRSCSNVTSNSCVKRIPMEEVISFSCTSQENVLIDKIETCFQLSVGRDIKLKSVKLECINIYLKYDRELHTKYYGTYYGQDLPKGLEVVLSGNLKLTVHKSKKEVSTDIGKEGVNTTTNVTLHADGSTVDKDKEEKEIVVYEEDLKIITTEGEQNVINITKPLVIEKSMSPYTLKLNLKCKNARSIQIKSFKRKESHRFESKHGVVTATDLFGHFTGINSISFENLSNRD